MIGIRSRPRYSAASAVVACDGNSLTFGNGATTSYPTALSGLAPLTNGSISASNVGVGGQRGSDMTANHADVNALFNSAKKNILVAWEITNSLHAGATAQGAVTEILNYVASVKAVNPWVVIVATAIPRYQKRSADASFTQTEVTAYNTVIDAANVLLRQQWASKADGLVDLVAGDSLFSFTGRAAADFDATGLYVNEAADGGTIRTHCSNAGYAEVARLVAVGLRRVSVRAKP